MPITLVLEIEEGSDKNEAFMSKESGNIFISQHVRLTGTTYRIKTTKAELDMARVIQAHLNQGCQVVGLDPAFDALQEKPEG